MTDKDIMLEMHIFIRRDGTVGLQRNDPQGQVTASVVMALGMLEVAKTILITDLKPGEAP